MKPQLVARPVKPQLVARLVDRSKIIITSLDSDRQEFENREQRRPGARSYPSRKISEAISSKREKDMRSALSFQRERRSGP